MKFGIRATLLYIIVLAFAFKSMGQDAHFSQFYASSLYLNPSLVGAENDITFKSNYRTQWRSITLPYVTSQVSIIYPIMTHSGMGLGDKHRGGVGVSFYNDKAGDGNFKTLGASLSGAYTLHLGDQVGSNMIIFGLQAGFIQKQLDFTNLEWGAQFNPYLGFDPTIDPGETQIVSRNTNSDVNAGMTWFYNGAKNYQVRKMSAYAGIAAYHLIPVNESLIANTFSQLPLLFKLHGGFELHLNHRINMSPNVLYLQQHKNNQLNGGLYFTYDAVERRQSGLITHANIILGAWYRLQDSYIFLAGIENPYYTFGISYDMNSSQLRTRTRGRGAFEISLAIRRVKERKQLKFSTPRI